MRASFLLSGCQDTYLYTYKYQRIMCHIAIMPENYLVTKGYASGLQTSKFMFPTFNDFLTTRNAYIVFNGFLTVIGISSSHNVAVSDGKGHKIIMLLRIICRVTLVQLVNFTSIRCDTKQETSWPSRPGRHPTDCITIIPPLPTPTRQEQGSHGQMREALLC